MGCSSGREVASSASAAEVHSSKSSSKSQDANTPAVLLTDTFLPTQEVSNGKLEKPLGLPSNTSCEVVQQAPNTEPHISSESQGTGKALGLPSNTLCEVGQEAPNTEPHMPFESQGKIVLEVEDTGVSTAQCCVMPDLATWLYLRNADTPAGSAGDTDPLRDPSATETKRRRRKDGSQTDAEARRKRWREDDEDEDGEDDSDDDIDGEDPWW